MGEKWKEEKLYFDKSQEINRYGNSIRFYGNRFSALEIDFLHSSCLYGFVLFMDQIQSGANSVPWILMKCLYPTNLYPNLSNLAGRMSRTPKMIHHLKGFLPSVSLFVNRRLFVYLSEFESPSISENQNLVFVFRWIHKVLIQIWTKKTFAETKWTPNIWESLNGLYHFLLHI